MQDIDFEVKRHAAAFGIERWHSIERHLDSDSHQFEWVGRRERWTVKCVLGSNGDWYLCIEDAEPDDPTGEFILFVDIRCTDGHLNVSWLLPAKERYNWKLSHEASLLLVSVLFRLGGPVNVLQAELEPELETNLSLSHHEQLELCLSMPRELWPAQWRAQEEAEIKHQNT